MKRSINQKIRDAAKSKVVIRITGRSRSAEGFDVIYPLQEGEYGMGSMGYTHDCINVPTRTEAESLLLAKARCCSELRFEIKTVNKKQAALPWCVACKKLHEKPTSAEHHAALQCRAKWREG